jgi:adenine-specific DNA-methyltransferase
LGTKAQEVKRHGKHYTPTGLADFLAGRVLNCLAPGQVIRVLDPACGDGELLFAMHRVASVQFPAMSLELVGYDLDPVAITVAEARSKALGIEVLWHQGDFLESRSTQAGGAFDAVITNPPYVRTQQLGQETARLLAADFGLSGRIDLTHPFVAMCPTLLRPGGVLGLLCSNRFLTTKAGANVRSILQQALRPTELYDLGDTKLFEAAVLPAIVVALNERANPSARQCSFASAYEVQGVGSDSQDLFDALTGADDRIVTHEQRAIAVKIGTLVESATPTEPWRLSHKSGDDWLQGIANATWATFGDIAKIRVGIKTTADSVFISDNWNSVPCPPEDDLLLPLITHHNLLTPWRISDHLPTRMLYPYDLAKSKRTLLNLTFYPETMAYLNEHADRLKGRKYVIEGGREWYEIWVPQRPALWAIPKIVFPDISEHARFAYDKSGALVNGDCYWISLQDIGDEDLAYLMVAVANSTLGTRFYDEVCGNKLYSGRRRWITQYVEKFPLPDPRSPASCDLILAVKRLLEHQAEPTVEELSELDAFVDAAFAVPAQAGSARTADTLF